jgi:NAD(P)-dependent dehydrogenase (short-subunit alcohol dehydrogenase family)
MAMDNTFAALPSPAEVRGLNDLSGKVALITGGGSGLGRAMAWALACHGADIVIVDRDGAAATACAVELAEGARVRAIGLTAEVSLEADVTGAAAAALQEFGRVDILINNAGHNLRKPTLEYTAEEFDSLYNVHVRGSFLFCRALGPQMQQRKSGSIINIASILGMIAARNIAPYGAAKASLAQLARVLAVEMAPFSVRVNAIAPGYIDTPLTRQHAPEVRKHITDHTPLGRFGEASELIGPVIFLASGASSFVTGTTLVVDGGWTAL